MLALDQIDVTYSPARPCAMAIGSFDGVHKGHRKILEVMRKKAGSYGTVCVFTFSNHPSHVLSGKKPVQLIYTEELKLQELANCGVDMAYCFEFDKDLSNLSYEEFLRQLKYACPFDFLILGEGARIGKNQQGTPDKLTQLGKQLGYSCEYVEKMKIGDEVISSGAIRKMILEGNLKRAEQFLSRPFAIEGEIKKKKVSVSSLICLPPDGKYPVIIDQQEDTLVIDKGDLSLEKFATDGKFTLQFS